VHEQLSEINENAPEVAQKWAFFIGDNTNDIPNDWCLKTDLLLFAAVYVYFSFKMYFL
jgi:hypothetical protein